MLPIFTYFLNSLHSGPDIAKLEKLNLGPEVPRGQSDLREYTQVTRAVLCLPANEC